MPDTVDHTRRTFASERAMCRSWGVGSPTFRQRRQRGWSVEAALTGTNPTEVSHVDHTGQVFSSERAMCARWNIGTETFRARRKRGLSVAEALTAPRLPHAARGARVIFDGKRYSNIRAFLRAHGYRGNSVYARLRADGLSQEGALSWIVRHAPLPDRK